MPTSDRPSLAFHVEERASLYGVLTKAASGFGVSPSPFGKSNVDYLQGVGFYIPDDEQGIPESRYGRWSTHLTIVSVGGETRWDQSIKEVLYSDLLRSADFGTIEGDPTRPYLALSILRAGPPVFPPGWDGLLTGLWDVADVLARVGGAGSALMGGYVGLRRVVRRGQRALQRHHLGIAQRGGSPESLGAFLAAVPKTTEQIALRLSCASNEAAAIAEVFGYSLDEDGYWRLGKSEIALSMREILGQLGFYTTTAHWEPQFTAGVEEFLTSGQFPPYTLEKSGLSYPESDQGTGDIVQLKDDTTEDPNGPLSGDPLED